MTVTEVQVAEAFISSFYSFDASKMQEHFLPDTDVVAIFYYQQWAKAANYQVKIRRECFVDRGEVVCAVTVTDDFGAAMGYEATDTFRMKVVGEKISAVAFSGDDPPIFNELQQWISQNQPLILSGPCFNMFAGGETPGDCARAIAKAARQFMAERARLSP